MLTIGGTEISLPIFLKYSVFPDVAELTIKYPLWVNVYNFPEPSIKPDILVSLLFFFKTFKILVDQIISPVVLSKFIKKPLLVTTKI